jgi:hypothetical protein
MPFFAGSRRIVVRVKGVVRPSAGLKVRPMTSSQILTAAVLTAGLLIAASPASADVLAGGHELVVLAEPAAPVSTGAAGPMDLTLTWTVREIFAGEPDSVTIAVRHQQVEPAQVTSLAEGGRWILLADRDEERPGRWAAPMPLRATPAAVEAFRKWSAPPDVRPERDLGTVVAEVREAEPARPPALLATVPEPVIEPEAAVEARAVVAEGPVVETVADDVIPDSPFDRDAAPAGFAAERVTVADSRRLVSATSPAPVEPAAASVETVAADEAEPVRVMRIAKVQVPTQEPSPVASEPATVRRPAPLPGPSAAPGEPPHTWQPALQPSSGPGLPPPPPSRPLGPALSERDDLKKAKPSTDEGA